MSKQNKKVFVVYKGQDGKVYDKPTEGATPIELAVTRPSQAIQKAAQLHVNRTFRDLVLGGTILKAQIDGILKERNLITEETKTKDKSLAKQIADLEVSLTKGGIKKSEGKKLAFELLKLRREQLERNADRNLLDQNTAEAQAENERFGYLVSECTVDNVKGQKYFKDFEDYNNRTDDPVPGLAAQHMLELVFDPLEMQKQRVEWQFLTKYGFADDKLRLVDKTGQFVDAEGRRVDEDGRYLNEEGQFCDIWGNPVDEEGKYALATAEFLDD